MNWAAGLDVDFGGTHYTDWRLPSTVDGSFVFGSNGTTTAGYNITNSEMGHLYYTELGNKGYWATDGTHPQLGWGLTNKGDFQHLIADIYWSGTEYSYYTSTDNAWVFNSYYGVQSTGDETLHSLYALAVRPGDVTVVPEPVSSMLFLTGGSLLVCRRYLVRSKA
ncbi:MAG: hypothetical protein HZC49_09470 [Nitrospirae bacterium]|nr:hypothetical protein [Nitrospirota bacterium]